MVSLSRSKWPCSHFRVVHKRWVNGFISEVNGFREKEKLGKMEEEEEEEEEEKKDEEDNEDDIHEGGE